jgi:Xaa-Pro dipeptidase
MTTSTPLFQLGPATHPISHEFHANHRRKLLDRLRRMPGLPGKSVVLLDGGRQEDEYDTDRERLFRQESFFRYLFGVKEPGFSGAIDVATGKTTLFMPRLPEAYAVWMGRIEPPEHFLALYGVDDVRYSDELPAWMAASAPEKLLLLEGKNSDSGSVTAAARFDGIEKYPLDRELLHPELVECRVTKSADEIELIRWLNRVSAAAHVEVMRRVRPGMSEFQLESLFLHEIYSKGGCRHVAYTSIFGCGTHSAILHYGHAASPHDGVLAAGQLFLNDSGAEYHGYSSDITCSWPVDGRFTADQRAIYEAVLAANRAVEAAMKPGVPWPDMHRLAERTIAERLLAIGLLTGELPELLANHIPALFMPHGLGHLMGLDVHDVGGYPKGIERIDEPGIRSLRCGRKLEEGMVITVEPGIYFIDALLEPALRDPVKSRFLVPEVVARFRNFGGIRLEDDMVVTATGAQSLTHVPRTVDEVEKVMAEGRAAFRTVDAALDPA